VRLGLCPRDNLEARDDVDGLAIAGFFQVATYGQGLDAILDILLFWDELSGFYLVESESIFVTMDREELVILTADANTR